MFLFVAANDPRHPRRANGQWASKPPAWPPDATLAADLAEPAAAPVPETRTCIARPFGSEVPCGRSTTDPGRMCPHHPPTEHPYPREAASAPSTTPETLARLASLEDRSVLERIARHPNTDPATLDRLASTAAHRLVRVGVARHPNTDAATLDRLAGDPDGMVRLEVASRPDATAGHLDTVAAASDVGGVIRNTVAEHPNTGAATLARLAADPDPEVRAAAAANPNTPAAGRSAGGLLAD